LLRKIVVFAVDQFAESAHGVFELDVLAFKTGELRRDEEGLREEPLDLSRARDRQLVFVRQLVETENRDDVLKIFVTLQHALNVLRSVVVFLTDNARIENARRRSQRIDRRINTQLHDLSRERRDGVEVRERRRRRW